MNLAPELQFCVLNNLEKSLFWTYRTIFCHFVFFEFHFFPEFVSKKWRSDYLIICRAISFFATFFKVFTNFGVDFFQLVYLVRFRCVKWVQDQQKWPSLIYLIEHMVNRIWIKSILLEKVLAMMSFWFCETNFDFLRPRPHWIVFFNVVLLSEVPVYIHDTVSTIWRTPLYSLYHMDCPRRSVKLRVGCITHCSFKKMNETFGNRFVIFLKFNMK